MIKRDTNTEPKTHSPTWGRLPHDVKKIIQKKEWDNLTSLKARLSGLKQFPVRIGLKPPNGRLALTNMVHFQRFFEEWNAYAHQELVVWSSRGLRGLSSQRIPIAIEIRSFQQLIQFLGNEALSRSHTWEKNMKPLLQVEEGLYHNLVKNIEVIETLSSRDIELLAQLLPQLTAGMGKGQYLRALPLIGIDTKFLENHYSLIEELANTLHKGAIYGSGGLLSWLDCITKPKGWLTVRPLCNDSAAAFGGLSILQIPVSLLRDVELPAPNILVVENLQSGLALPSMNNTIAVIGGGNNVTWMNASWLQKKRVGYWGDIDTWGLSILSEARRRFTGVESLMMDLETVELHNGRLVSELNSTTILPTFLNEEEIELFNALATGPYMSLRLEQERLSSNYIQQNLFKWHEGR